MKRYRITEQNHNNGQTREIAEIEAATAADALNGSVTLPDWTIGCPIDDDADGGAFIADPDDEQHAICADLIDNPS